MSTRAIAIAAGVLLLAGCGVTTDASGPDAGTGADAGVDADPDAAGDAGGDPGDDPASDASSEPPEELEDGSAAGAGQGSAEDASAGADDGSGDGGAAADDGGPFEDQPLPDEPAPEDPDSGSTGDVAAGAEPDGSRLLVAMRRFEEVLADDPDAYDGRCQRLGDWQHVRSVLADVPDGDRVLDGGYLRTMGTLDHFGCAFGRHVDDGLHYPGVIVSVVREPTELSADARAVTTPAGLDARLTVDEIGDLSLLMGEPVGAAVVVLDGTELQVTAAPELLAPEELLPVVDAAWEDLGELG